MSLKQKPTTPPQKQRTEMDRILRLTRSQEMALIEILVAYARTDEVQTFLNCSTDPATEVTTGELLQLIAGTLRGRDHSMRVVSADEVAR